LYVGNGSSLTLHGGDVINSILDLAAGSIEITNGGTVKVASGDFGEVFVGSPEAPTPQGSITVDGQGSTLQTEKQLTLSGSASMTISDRGAVSVLGVGGSMTVTGSSDGPATVDVTGGSTLKVNGSLLVMPGGKVTVDATSKVSLGSGAFGPPGSLYITKGGALGGNPDEIDANVMVTSGGSLTPAIGAGSLTIHGNYTERGGSFFQVTLDGTTPDTGFGVLHVTGTATVGGTLEVEVAPGFTPTAGQAFTILQAGMVKGKFSKVVGATATYTPTGVSIIPLTPAIPFGEVAGLYEGLAPLASGTGLEGRLALAVSMTGKFTGQFAIGGKTYKFANTLTASGTYSGTITTGGQTLTVNLTADLTGASQAVTGSIGIGGASYQVGVDRAAFSATNPPPVVGAYTIILPANSDNSDLNAPRPQGTGWATATISASGNVHVVGKLADGTAFSAAGPLTADNSVALYAPLYKSAGLLSGSLTFALPAADEAAEMSNVAGVLAWSKPAQATNQVFPKAFSTTLTVFGSTYGPPSKGHRIFFGIDPTGDAALTFSGAGLPSPVTKGVVLSTADKASYPHPANAKDKLTLAFTAGTGSFSGTFIDPVNSVKTAFSGVVLQNVQTGEGYFLGSSDSGTVEIAP
jgi:T5SS/PEP-CTERM-associated repeat protein